MEIIFLSVIVNIIMIIRLLMVSFRGKAAFQILIASNIIGFFIYWYKYNFSIYLLLLTSLFVLFYTFIFKKLKQ